MPGTHLFCVNSKEEAEKVIEYRKSRGVADLAKSEREATVQRERDARAEAISALIAETGKNSFTRPEIDAKVVEVRDTDAAIPATPHLRHRQLE